MHPAAGIRDRRVHGAVRIAAGLRRAHARCVRRWATRIRGQGGHRLHRAVAPGAAREAVGARAEVAPDRGSTARRRRARRALGRAEAGRGSRVHGVDGGRPRPPPIVPGAARGQTSTRGRARARRARDERLARREWRPGWCQREDRRGARANRTDRADR